MISLYLNLKLEHFSLLWNTRGELFSLRHAELSYSRSKMSTS